MLIMIKTNVHNCTSFVRVWVFSTKTRKQSRARELLSRRPVVESWTYGRLKSWRKMRRSHTKPFIDRRVCPTNTFHCSEGGNPLPPNPAAHPQHADGATQLLRWLTKQRHQLMWVLTLPGERQDLFFPQVLRHVFGYRAFLSLLCSWSKFNQIKIFRVKWLPSKTSQTITR